MPAFIGMIQQKRMTPSPSLLVIVSYRHMTPSPSLLVIVSFRHNFNNINKMNNHLSP